MHIHHTRTYAHIPLVLQMYTVTKFKLLVSSGGINTRVTTLCTKLRHTHVHRHTHTHTQTRAQFHTHVHIIHTH